QSVGLGEPIAMIAANEEEARSLNGEGDSSDVSTAAPATSPVPAGVETAQASVSQAGPSSSSNGPQSNGAEPGGRVKASPLARRLAQENGIDLKQLTGTGPGGRITKEDVQAFVNGSGAATPPATEAPAPPETQVEAPPPAAPAP